MKTATEALFLTLLACAFVLGFSHLFEANSGEAARPQAQSRRQQAIEYRKVLDDMKSRIRDMREKASHGSSEQRAAFEQEMLPIEELLQQTQEQLLLFDAQDGLTGPFLGPWFKVIPTLEMPSWKNDG